MLATLLADPNFWISLLTLTILEIVLGIDNIIFISILAGKLPAEQQGRARTIGLMIALVTRVLLLCSIFWLSKLIDPLFHVGTHPVSGKDLVLIAGGLFLLWKSVHEIHGSVENLEQGEHDNAEERLHDLPGGGERPKKKSGVTMTSVISQIVVIDIVFSLDSVITAVGLAEHIQVMIAAVVLAMIVMLLASKTISDYVNKHPTIKMLALSFLLLVGVVLVADGCGQHVPKGYIYFAMAFSFAVEMLNIRMRTNRQKAHAVTAPGGPAAQV